MNPRVRAETTTGAASGSANGALSAEVGRLLIGPVLLEFCRSLHEHAAHLAAGSDAVLLFCARGGLRLQLAYERYLRASGLTPSVPVRSLMVSRLVAMRSALDHAARHGGDPSSALVRVLRRDFRTATLGESLRALMPREVESPRFACEDPVRAQDVVRALREPSGRSMAEAIASQRDLFDRHLASRMGGRRRMVLVDTGRFGTTGTLLDDSHHELRPSSLLMVRVLDRDERSPGRHRGVSVEARRYSPVRPRTAALRHWHLFENLLEPDLPTVAEFRTEGDDVVSDLEVDSWAEQVTGDDASLYGGALAYIDDSANLPVSRIRSDVERAWRLLHRAIVLPTPLDAQVFGVNARSFDLGRDGAWGPRPWRGPVDAMHGLTLWREGEIAASGTPLRIPLLMAIESAYAARAAVRSVLEGPSTEPERRRSHPSRASR